MVGTERMFCADNALDSSKDTRMLTEEIEDAVSLEYCENIGNERAQCGIGMGRIDGEKLLVRTVKKHAGEGIRMVGKG